MDDNNCKIILFVLTVAVVTLLYEEVSFAWSSIV